MFPDIFQSNFDPRHYLLFRRSESLLYHILQVLFKDSMGSDSNLSLFIRDNVKHDQWSKHATCVLTPLSLSHSVVIMERAAIGSGLIRNGEHKVIY